LNIIEYLFCERLFGQVLLIEKKCGRKMRQKKCAAEKCGRKSAAEKWQEKCGRKMWQKKCGRKSAARKVCGKKVRQKNVCRQQKNAAQNRGTRMLQEEKGMVFICVVLNL
jgi:uncharacterized protein (DUF2147 family)